VRKPFARPRTHDDFSAEIQAHIDLETDRLIAAGLTAQDARDAARRAFGNVAIVKERFYEASRWVWLEQFLQDLRYAWRGMRRSPAFVLTAVLTLAVGLGLITIAFTVFNAYVLRPFAVRDPESLHQIVWRAKDAGGQQFHWRDQQELAERHDLFTAVVGEDTRFVSSDGRPLALAVVSRNYFEALGPSMQLGRGLVASDVDDPGDPAVISHEAWTRLYGRSPSVLGQTLDINGRRATIVGVLASGFTGLGDWPRDVFLPRASEPERAVPEIEIMVRLRRDVTRNQAEAALAPFMIRVIPQRGPVTVEVRPQASPNPMTVEQLAIVAPVFAAFVLVLVTACANVSNVMLARAIGRHREIAVRLSIGASRSRVIRQLLTEGLLIALLAGAAGLALAHWGLDAAVRAFFSTLPASVQPMMRVAPLTFDLRVFLFAVTATLATALLFALLPALQASRVSLTDALRGQGAAAHRGSRLRDALVVGQVAVAIVLVIVAITLWHTGATIGGIDLGFRSAGVLSVNVRGGHDELASPLAEALASDPRAGLVAVTSGNPLFNQARRLNASTDDGHASARIRRTFVSPEFFPILELPIERGREFRVDEARTGAAVAIVSTATANSLWPGQDPLGKTIRLSAVDTSDDPPELPVVTVVGTVRDIVSGLIFTGPDTGHIYLPTHAAGPHATAVLVRERAGAPLTPSALQDIFRRVASDPQTFEAVPLEEMRGLQMYPVLAASWVGSLLGGIALALSISGLYGVLSYALSQRTAEIGIRMALGATARAVVGLVMRQSLRLAAIGATVGVVVTFLVLTTLNAAMRLATVSLVDAGAFAAGLLLIVIATMLAAYQPARRATRIDPSQTLRADA